MPPTMPALAKKKDNHQPLEWQTLATLCASHWWSIFGKWPPVGDVHDLRHHDRTDEHGWRDALVVAGMCALFLSFATRFWISSSILPTSPTAKSHMARSIDRRSLEPRRPHLDRVAAQRSPTIDYSNEKLTILELHLAPTKPRLLRNVFTESIFVRPPPVLALLLLAADPVRAHFPISTTLYT